MSETTLPELNITRTFNAPIAKVWKAWSDPAAFMQWWGPKEFTCPVAKLDFRVGGKYHTCMQDPSGMKFWSVGIYKEIVPMTKIVCSDSFADENGNVVSAAVYGMPDADQFPMEMEIIVNFEDLGDKTKMTLKQIGHPVGKVTEMATQGWNESFDKIDKAL